MRRVIPRISKEFAPIRQTIFETFFPTFIGDPLVYFHALRKRLVLPVKFGGMGLPDPVTTAYLLYSTSVKMTRTLTATVQTGDLGAGPGRVVGIDYFFVGGSRVVGMTSAGRFGTCRAARG